MSVNNTQTIIDLLLKYNYVVPDFIAEYLEIPDSALRQAQDEWVKLGGIDSPAPELLKRVAKILDVESLCPIGGDDNIGHIAVSPDKQHFLMLDYWFAPIIGDVHLKANLTDAFNNKYRNRMRLYFRPTINDLDLRMQKCLLRRRPTTDKYTYNFYKNDGELARYDNDGYPVRDDFAYNIIRREIDGKIIYDYDSDIDDK